MLNISDELELATVDQIKAKRFDWYTRQIEYLVSWKEYPGEETWECVDNLSTVKYLLDAFDYDKKVKDLA